jgi:hypothetical protein
MGWRMRAVTCHRHGQCRCTLRWLSLAVAAVRVHSQMRQLIIGPFNGSSRETPSSSNMPPRRWSTANYAALLGDHNNGKSFRGWPQQPRKLFVAAAPRGWCYCRCLPRRCQPQLGGGKARSSSSPSLASASPAAVGVPAPEAGALLKEVAHAAAALFAWVHLTAVFLWHARCTARRA